MENSAMGKISVCQIVNNLDSGGLEKVALSLLHGLDREHFDVSLICVDGPGALFNEQDFSAIPTLVLNKSRFSLLRKLPIVELAKIRRFLSAHQVDVIHAHNWAPLIYANAACRLPGKKPRVIFSEHNQLNRASEGQIRRFAAELKKAELAILVSKDLDAKYQQHFPTIKQRKVVYNGIDGNRFALEPKQQATLPGNPEHFTVGTAVVLSEQKGLTHLISAAEQLHQRHPDIRFVIAGDGPLRQQLEQQAADAGLEQCLHFMGYQTNIPAIAAAFDVYVLPSLWEGLPLSLIEALALGKPVIASDVGGNAEIILDGENGFIVAAKDQQGLADRIGQLYENRQNLNQYALRNRARFEDQFSLRAMIENHQEIYRPPV